MQGKADMLVAKRTLSALIVVCVVVSAFAGLMLFAQPQTPLPARAQAIGDLTISSGTYTIENIDQPIAGNVNVTGTGQLVIKDGSLSVISNYDSAQRHSIRVSGASAWLKLEHGTITTYLDQIDPWPFLTITIESGGHLLATEESLLMFPGTININSGATVTLNDTTVTRLPTSEVQEYVVGTAGLVSMDSADDGPAISVSSSTLQLFDSNLDALPEYPGEMIAASNLTLSGSSSLLAVNSYVGVDFGPAIDASDWYTHNVLALSGTSTANLYGTSFKLYSGADADRSPAVVTAAGSNAYFYRWLNVTVGDEYGVPIPGAKVSSVFTGSETYEGVTAFYFWAGGTHNTPDPAVLSYMGKDAASFNVTGSNGIARIPYLTDMVLGALAPYSLFVGSFELTGSATISSVVYRSTETFAFPAYPAMATSDQNFEVTVELSGVSAPSPNQSRWLVVPVNATQTDLTINDMSFYHAGDVIVAADGLLTLDQTTFQLVQTTPYQRTVFVDGTPGHPGHLVVQNSVMLSALPINIIVKGVGILEIVNSELIGVNIIAEGSSQVILRNSTMDGTLTTSWDSQSTIAVSDSELVQTPVLSGSSRGGFTNTSVPSITVEDSAYAQIFRWIHVWVYDGAGQPLPNADVEARYYVNGSVAASAVTDITGVAKVNSLGTNITAAGSSFVGNYKVNATYTYGASTHYATEELSVGVMPYTEPLGRNATYATLVIPDVFPDLAIHASPVPITLDPSFPLRNTLTTVTAVVNNDGESYAFDVQVNFYDVVDGTFTGNSPPNTATLFGIGYIDAIAPGSNGTATALWTVDYPVPTGHVIVAVADPEESLVEIDETWAQQSYGLDIVVQVMPDLTLNAYEIRCLETPEIDKQVNVSATILNNGDARADSVTVRFYQNNISAGNLIGTAVIATINPNGAMTAKIQNTFTEVGPVTIYVVVDPADAIAESDETNNMESTSITVYDHPDLELTGLSFLAPDLTPVDDVNADTWLNFTAVLWNNGAAPVVNPVVTLWINSSQGADEMKTITVTGTFIGPSYFSAAVRYPYKVPRLDYQETVVVTMVVNWNHATLETNYANNLVTDSFTIRDDRPDLSVAVADIHVMRGGQDIQSETFGTLVSVVTTVKNLGGREANFKMRVNVSQGDYNYTVQTLPSYNISANATDSFKDITVAWTISQTIQGGYQIWVTLDPTNEVSETNETNNMAARNFTISQLHVTVSITTDNTEYKAGKTMVISATIGYSTGSQGPVKSLPGVTFFLVDRNGVAVEGSTTDPATTDTSGQIQVSLIIPLNLETGQYSVNAMVAGLEYTTTATVQVSSSVQGGLFPIWVWIVIIIAVVAVVAGFTIYTYVYGLGKLVECGECGAFIPAASKRCPKCGVEFEAGTMKCSECGAWIPADSTECPNCGVKFLGEIEDEADYMERMRKEYDEMVSKYRELAKAELGKKFSDREFEDWFRTQPGYITFDDWLAKEEEKKKEGPVPCPVCGTLNPKEATVCHKCGTVFGAGTAQMGGRKGPPPSAPQAVTPAQVQQEAVAQQQPPGAAPRMVIRRPIDRKVVPKKIIKTPLGEEKTEGGDEGGENQ